MTAPTHHETEIAADQHVPAVHITREFDAPPENVFRAHADPELAARWIGPHAVATRIDHYDCRTGGAYRYVCVHEGVEHAFRGCFHDVRPGELIVQTFTYEAEPDGVALERLVLHALNGGRTRLTATSLVDSFEARDAMLASGMDVGVREGYDKLDEVLAA